MVLCGEDLQVAPWVTWLVLATYAIEAILIVVLLGAEQTWTGLIYIGCIVLQSLALGCAVLWRLNKQPVLLQ